MDFNTSYINIRKDLLKHISGKELDILDVGCATGENGRFLLETGVAKSVIGVEYDTVMSQEAAGKMQRVYNDSIESAELLAELNKYKFDFVLLGDVLEHLIDPWNVLLQLSKTLKPNGSILISAPNVQHIEIFICVFLKGTWPRNTRGLFDATHLRWFTKKDLESLADQAGLQIKKMDRNLRFRDAHAKAAFPIWSLPFKYLFPNLFTHQYIFVCALK